MKSKSYYPNFVLLSLLGIAATALGFIVFAGPEAKVLTGILIGLGSGTAGFAASKAITERLVQNNPQLKRTIDIEANDERDNLINLMAKAKAFDFGVYLPLPVFILATLLGAETKIILMLVGAYVLSWIVYLWNLGKLHREM